MYSLILEGSTGVKSKSGCLLCICTYVTCSANFSSSSLLGISNIKKRISNLDSKAAGRFILSRGDNLGLILPYNGFAAAKIEVLAPGFVLITALDIEIVCCSITSWIAVLSLSSILSNSSIQQIPLSASTKAPPSRIISSVTGSFMTAAVRPTPEEPLPVVYTPRGDILQMAFSS
uniref:Uncharacterized protein n=1 Tax=Saccharomyces cerevisiae TaxID=4932 RepID=E9PAC6_YEASX|nr:unknown [Saccharomyces cerevisiae]